MKAVRIGAMALGSLAVSSVFGPAVLKGYESTAWPRVDAKVVNASVVQTEGFRRTARPVVTYTYSIEGRAYTSQQTTFHSLVFDPHAVIARAPKNSIVKVAVNPSRAGESVFEPGFSLYDAGLIALCWFLTILGSVAVSRQKSLPPRPEQGATPG